MSGKLEEEHSADMKLFGLTIRNSKLWFLVIGIIFFFGCHNYMQELIMSLPGFKVRCLYNCKFLETAKLMNFTFTGIRLESYWDTSKYWVWSLVQVSNDTLQEKRQGKRVGSHTGFFVSVCWSAPQPATSPWPILIIRPKLYFGRASSYQLCLSQCF